MKVYWLENLPDIFERYYSCELSDNELDEIKKKSNADVIFYYYGAGGGYAGVGWMLLLKDGMWDWHDMGHCSCYGPVDMYYMGFSRPVYNLPDLKRHFSEEAYEQIEPLVQLALTNDYF